MSALTFHLATLLETSPVEIDGKTFIVGGLVEYDPTTNNGQRIVLARIAEHKGLGENLTPEQVAAATGFDA
jgi:hypothetical protein